MRVRGCLTRRTPPALHYCVLNDVGLAQWPNKNHIKLGDDNFFLENRAVTVELHSMQRRSWPLEHILRAILSEPPNTTREIKIFSRFKKEGCDFPNLMTKKPLPTRASLLSILFVIDDVTILFVLFKLDLAILFYNFFLLHWLFYL